MSERIENGFHRLFEARLLHHYWLDEGATSFDSIPDQAKKDIRLLTYDVQSILSITPTPNTAKVLAGLGGVYRNTALGCMIGVPKDVNIPTNTTFDFVVTVKDPEFFNYTSLTLLPQKIYEFYQQEEKITYRYKENVPLLSNLTGGSRGAGPNKSLFLTKEIPAPSAEDQVEFLVISGDALFQLTGDQPGAGTLEINSQASTAPIFFNQGDVPQIIPPDGVLGVPSHGIQLTADISDRVYALVRLSAVREDDTDFSLVDSSGLVKIQPPTFWVHFKNRSTIWKYLNKKNGLVESTEAKPLPLTYFGNAGTKQKPSEGIVKIEKNGEKITQLTSEVFV